MKRVKAFINDNIFRQILALSIPSMVGMFFETLHDIINMAWVGSLSVNSVAAITIFATVLMIINTINEVVGTSSVTLISRAYGSGDREKTVEIVEQTIIFKFMLALAAGGIMSIFVPWVLRPLANNGEILSLAVLYGRIRLITLPLAYSSYTVNTALRCIGDAKKPLYIMALTSITNIILDPLLIFDTVPFIGIKGAGLGIAGAAYATVISQCVAFLIGLYILMSGKSNITIRFKRGIYFVRSTDMKLLTVGLPSGVESLFRNAASFVIMKYITVYGVNVVAAYGICMRVMSLITMPIFGLEMGTSVIVGQNMGAGRPERAEKAGYTTARTSFTIIALAGILLWLLPYYIMRIFTQDSEIIREGMIFLKFYAVAVLFLAPAGGLASVLYGSGDNVPSMINGIITTWLLQIPLMYAMVNVLHTGVGWLWSTYIAAYALQFAVVLWFVRRGKWKQKCI